MKSISSVMARTVVAGILAAGLTVVTPGTSLAASTTTVTFDDLAAGTKVSNQYDAAGLDFVTGIYGNGAQGPGSDVYCYPVVTAVAAGQAESGDQVADASCANGEFPDTSVRGNFHNSAENVSLYAGFAPNSSWVNPPASATVDLNAYDVQGDVVASTSASVPTGAGVHTPLAVSSATPNIVGFDVTSNDEDVSVDSITYDNPSGVPADFALTAQNGFVPVAQGTSATDEVTVQRYNGSLGAITFSASDLPAGVTATFSPNPATADTTTITLSAAPSATPFASGVYPYFTITGTPASASVGPAPRTTSVQVGVQSLFASAPRHRSMSRPARRWTCPLPSTPYPASAAPWPWPPSACRPMTKCPSTPRRSPSPGKRPVRWW